MSAIVTPGPQRNKSKLLDRGCGVIRQAGKTDDAEIKSTDKNIDKLVYEFYGLTPEEIKAVEGPAGGERKAG